ncbi:glycine-rich domain-containing protein [Pseudomonas sp. KU43P]|uniref:glycine-rich domain-containing protein n=1 Tax=Pseudomonas sp. KU43P TaxID=2487887 RepID=UPI0039872DF6
MGTLVVNAPAVPGYIAVGTNALKTITLTHQDPPLQLVCLADGVYQVLCASAFSISSNNFPYRSKIFYKVAGIYQWTVPTNVTRVSVHVRGGGGSGSFVIDSVSRGAGGGGAGGVCERFCAVTPGSVITVTVGAGGTAVTTDGEAGITGGTSSFGTFCSSTGGRGGNVNGGAAGGVGIGGDFNASLGMGFPPVRNLNNTGSWGGQGGGGESIFAAADSALLTQPGMGGGGRSITRSQPGVDGCVIITY